MFRRGGGGLEHKNSTLLTASSARSATPSLSWLSFVSHEYYVKKPTDALSYRDIVAKWNPRPEVDEIAGMYFNGPDTIRRKTESALQSQLGGVMVCELGQDAPGERSLLRAIREVVNQPPK